MASSVRDSLLGGQGSVESGASSDGGQATLASSDAERENPSVQVVVREAEARTIMESEASGVGLVQRLP